MWTRVREGLTVRGASGPRPARETREALRSSLLRLFLADFVELHVRPPRPATDPAERARHQARVDLLT
ncbi:MAG TPA: hypothetical protein PKA62_10165, partial [Thermoanaerobaculia bacterium]|nr:hypothetical protein [Thermoanaerobaculia bacterium]